MIKGTAGRITQRLFCGSEVGLIKNDTKTRNIIISYTH